MSDGIDWYPRSRKQRQVLGRFGARDDGELWETREVEKTFMGFYNLLPLEAQIIAKIEWEDWLDVESDRVIIMYPNTLRRFLQRWREIERLPIDEQIVMGGKWYARRHCNDANDGRGMSIDYGCQCSILVLSVRGSDGRRDYIARALPRLMQGNICVKRSTLLERPGNWESKFVVSFQFRC